MRTLNYQEGGGFDIDPQGDDTIKPFCEAFGGVIVSEVPFCDHLWIAPMEKKGSARAVQLLRALKEKMAQK